MKAGLLSGGQAQTLLVPLQEALDSIMSPEMACASLVAFDDLLRGYVDAGVVIRKTATPLWAASR